MLKYKRVLIKLSGGALKCKNGDIFNHDALEHIAKEIIAVKNLGVSVAIVIGGGNILRGNTAEYWGMERAEADNIGMLGTIINALMLKAALNAKLSYEVRVMTAIKMEEVAETYLRLRAIEHLNKGYIVIMAGGIGQPFVTTDYPAAQRAIEVKCDALFVAKEGVDGVCDADPKYNKEATLYSSLSYNDLITNQLNVMDYSAVLLAKDYDLPIHIFNFNQSGVMNELCSGNSIGTTIARDKKMKTYDK